VKARAHDTDGVLVTRSATYDPTPPAETPVVAAPADHRRLSEMFHQHFDFVWRSVRRLGVPSHAIDDAAQEVFVVASRRLAIIEPGKEKAFLAGTAVRVASDARRSQGRRREDRDVEVDEESAHTPGADELVDQKRAREMLDEIIAELPDETGPVFVLHELEGMTMAEIATCLDLKPGTVASRLRRARAAFEEAIARLQAPRRPHV
jgi:RNA polymerase sigma-70 factor, ECF subfamily